MTSVKIVKAQKEQQIYIFSTCSNRRFLASLRRSMVVSLPNISIISNGPGEAFLPDKAALKGHNSSPFPSFSAMGIKAPSSSFFVKFLFSSLSNKFIVMSSFLRISSSGCTPFHESNSRSYCGLRSEEHTSELQSQSNHVCRLLL